MVKGRHQRHSGRQQQPVAEHIARHVTNAGHADGLGLHVGAQFAEMPLHRNPRALGGDGHRLVVIAIAATRREGIAQPEALALGNAIGGVGKGCGALVGGNHQIRVGRIVADHASGRQHGAGHIQIVGDRQQCADIDAIGLGAFRQPRITVRCRRQQLGIETALGTGWHDHGILYLLRLHQAQHFGAEIVAPVRPAQAAAGDRPAAQVDALHARGEHPDLAIGDWVGQSGHGCGIDLEGHRLRPAGHEEIGPQRGKHGRSVQADDAIIIDAGYFGQAGINAGQHLFLRLGAIRDIQRKAHREQRHQIARDIRIAFQRIHRRHHAVSDACLPQIAEPRPQKRSITGLKAAAWDQRVEAVIFLRAQQHGDQRRLQPHRQRRQIGKDSWIGHFTNEIVDAAQPAIVEIERIFLDHLQAEILQHRHRFGKRNDRAEAIQLQAQLAGLRRGHDAHGAIILVLQRGERHDVGSSFGRLMLGAIAGRKGPAVAARQSRRAGRRHQLSQGNFQIFFPAAHQLAQPAIERGGLIGGEAGSVGHIHHIVHARQALFAQFHLVTRDAALQFLRQHLAGGFAQAAGVEITRHINERGNKATERIGAGKQLRPRTVEQ